jgi:hypothetical protein
MRIYTSALPALALTIFLAASCQFASARSIAVEPAAATAAALKVAQEAVTVLVGSSRKVRVGEQECGFQYEAKVIRTVKGKTFGKSINFGFRGGLEPGKRYTVFFHDGRDIAKLREYLVENAGSSAEVDRFLDTCRDVIGERYWFFADKKINGVKKINKINGVKNQ